MFSPSSRPVTAYHGWRSTLRHALGLAVAFVTLDDRPIDRCGVPPHPHRRPLRAPDRAGRPGSVPARPQVCRTPLGTRRSRTRDRATAR